MHKSAVLLLGIGTIATALSLVIGWLGFPHMVKNYIRKGAVLDPGSRMYELWSSEPKVPIYLKFYFFNVTNAHEVGEGAKPSVVEIGPYTYLQRKVKHDIELGELNGTLHYHQQTWIHFLPNISAGSEQDLVTLVNVPLVSAAKGAVSRTAAPGIHELINDNLANVGEKLFRTSSIHEMLFDGVPVEPYLALMSALDMTVPKALESGRFGFYREKNGSSKFFDVESGKFDWKELGQIRKYDNMTTLPWWKTDECNELRGTDGTIYAPLLTPQSRLYAFSPELCRTMSTVYDREVPFKGLTLFRFTTAAEMGQGTKTNPKNACFCYEKRLELCERDGLIMMSGCRDGAPLSFSAPHFYGGEARLASSINGLDPDEDKHRSFLDIEPWTAVLLRAAKRLQLNIDLERIESMSLFARVQPMAMPIMWVEESVEVTEDFLPMFRQLYWLLTALNIGKWVMVVVSLMLLGLGCCLGLFRKEKEEMLVAK